jgi:SAM-dependent methyltransferase
MWEQSKAAKRRYSDGLFHGRYLVGRGIDIGGKPDPLGQFKGIFPLMGEVRTWDLEDGDAQYMKGVPDESQDFVHSSHCLEHMVDVRLALSNWIRIVRPGGFLIITVPDEDLYEHGQWPSRFNSDHKWSFTICKRRSAMPKSINVVDLAIEFADRLELERLQLVGDFHRPLLGPEFDQTLTPVAECAIEIVWRKREKQQP